MRLIIGGETGIPLDWFCFPSSGLGRITDVRRYKVDILVGTDCGIILVYISPTKLPTHVLIKKPVDEVIRKIKNGLFYEIDYRGNQVTFYQILNGLKKYIEKRKLSIRALSGYALALLFKDPWLRGRLFSKIGIKNIDQAYLSKALQEWQKVNKPYAKLFSAELYRLLGEFDKAKKLLDQAKKHYQKGKAAYYCRVVKELIKMKTTHFYDVPDIIGETQHKVGELTLLISPSGIKLRKVKKGFLGKKFVVEEISKREAMKFFDKLDDLGKAKLMAGIT